MLKITGHQASQPLPGIHNLSDIRVNILPENLKSIQLYCSSEDIFCASENMRKRFPPSIFL